MEAPMNPEIKKYVTDPRYGPEFAKAFIEQAGKSDTIIVKLSNGVEFELVQVGSVRSKT